METPSTLPSVGDLLTRFNTWIEESITVKLFSIGFLVLILLIPSSWVNDLIEERQGRADGVVTEISDKWSGSQTLSGPILVVPYTYYDKVTDIKGQVELIEKKDNAYFLPEIYKVTGNVNPETLHRGIFEAVVYSSELDIKAQFKQPDFKKLNISAEMARWEDAYLIFAITDIRGITSTPLFKDGTNELATEPSNSLDIYVTNYAKEYSTRRPDYAYDASNNTYKGSNNKGIIAKLNCTTASDFNGNISMKLNLRGSQHISFVPTGKETAVEIKGLWSTPSFDGEFLPETRDVSGSSFNAKWNILHFNRPFSQQWTGFGKELTGSEFGLKLLVPVDQYQKSIRTAKYSILIIMLTFVALLLVEIVKKIRIHPFQYILIGSALIIYYTLLLSISEQVSYNLAYWIATGLTVILISLYSKTFLKQTSLVIMLTLMMGIFYSFIFVIILQQDLSLLIGSIGLFIVVATLMYFSRKVTWYKPVVQ